MNQISPINSQQLLEQIRSYSGNLQAPENSIDGTSGFGEMLKSTLDSVNEAQMHAGDMTKAFSAGEGSATLAEVMISGQKANLSFRAVTEVRNKLVTAYQDIMNMPV